MESIRVSFRATDPHVLATIRSLADRRRTTISAVLRGLIVDGLEAQARHFASRDRDGDPLGHA